MNTPATTLSTSPTASFESALGELEKLVSTLEQGEASLTESLAAYRRGRQLLDYCRAQLAEAENQLQLLESPEKNPSETDDAGDLAL